MFDPMIELYPGICLGHSVHSVHNFFTKQKEKTSFSAQCEAV